MQTAEPTSETLSTLTPDVLAGVLLSIREGLTSEISALLEDKLVPLMEAPARPEPLLTIDDVADYLQVSKRTVETLLAEGDLVALRVRGTRRFTRDAVNAYLRSLDGRRRRRRST